MELDEFKYQLQSKLSVVSEKSTDDIDRILHGKTQSVFHKLKQSMYFEIGSAIAVIIIFLYVAFVTKYAALRAYFLLFAVVFIAFMLIISFLLKQVRRAETSALPLKQNIQNITSILKTYVKRYFQFMLLLLPVCFLLSFWLGVNEKETMRANNSYALVQNFENKSSVYLFLVVYFIVLAVGLYYFTRWYIKKLSA